MSWTGAGIGAAIGTLFGGPIGAGVGAVIGSMMEEDEEVIDEEYGELKLKVKKSEVEYEDGTKGDFFILTLNGDIVVPGNYCKVKTTIEIFDTTDEIEKIVFTNEETYTNNGDGVFFIETEMTIPYEVSSYDNIEMEQIFIDNLILPRKGKRKLFFKYTIIDSLTGENIQVLYSKISNYSNEDGYEDIQEKKPIIEELSIQAAFFMSSIDGSIDLEEGKTLSNFGKKILEEYLDDDYEVNKKRINSYISSAYKDAKSKKINIDSILAKININCTIDIKYVIFDICLDVAAADGVADKNELELAYYMAEKLELDKDEYTKMIEKKLPINMHNEEDLEHTFEKNLGITPNMSKQEIGKILRKEFKKWNQRVSNSDILKREQAELMLQKISELRTKYK